MVMVGSIVRREVADLSIGKHSGVWMMRSSDPKRDAGSGNARLRCTDPTTRTNGIATISGRSASGASNRKSTYMPTTIFWLRSGKPLNCSSRIARLTAQILKLKRHKQGRVSCPNASHLLSGWRITSSTLRIFEAATEMPGFLLVFTMPWTLLQPESSAACNSLRHHCLVPLLTLQTPV